MTNPTKYEWRKDGTMVSAENGNRTWFYAIVKPGVDVISAATDDERLAIARLMWAAPQLLASLKEIIHDLESPGDCVSDDLMEQAKAAIRAAEGGE